MPARMKKLADEAVASGSEPDFSALLRELDDGQKSLKDWQEKADAGAAFRQVYDTFVKRGGYERGKPRHAARQIKLWLGKDQVRSLETKLAGKTWLQYQDAFNLLKLFLSRWWYDKATDSYTPYQRGDIEALAHHLLSDLFADETKAILLPERSRASVDGKKISTAAVAPAQSALELTRPSADAIKEFFAASDALVTVSRVKTIIGSDPAEAMAGFHDLMADLYEIDQNDQQKRVAIWVIDMGLRNDKTAARGALYNVHFLVAQFRAILLINRRDRELLPRWLLDNVCVIVGSLALSEIDQIYDKAGIKFAESLKDLRWFQSDRLFFESVPTRWLDVPGNNAFGLSQSELWLMPTITAHLRLEDWDELNHSTELDIRKNLRYLLHGEVNGLAEDQGELPKYEREDIVRCIDLPHPGSRWSDAYRLAIQAAFGRLNRPGDKRLGDVRPEQALAQLRSQHFAALTLNEFLCLPDALTRAAQADLIVK